MCVIAFALDASPRWRLVLAANRDELHDRPTDALRWWPDMPGVCGGRDRLAGGTWMALSRGGRFAALTNVRDGLLAVPADARSRGGLVADYVGGTSLVGAASSGADGHADAAAYASHIAAHAHRYAGFNLLLGDLSLRTDWWYVGSTATARRVEPGLHGVSNGTLNADWPKVRQLQQAVAAAAASAQSQRDSTAEEALFEVLRSTAVAPDEHLPDTGVGLERERLLAPLYVRAPGYGTRCSTVLRVARDGSVRITERTWPLEGERWVERSIEFKLD